MIDFPRASRVLPLGATVCALASCTAASPPSPDFRAGEVEYEQPDPVADGLPYEEFAELEEQRLALFAHDSHQIVREALLLYSELEEESIDRGEFTDTDLAMVHEAIDAEGWDPESFGEQFPWAVAGDSRPEEYWSAKGHEEFGQHISALTACGEYAEQVGQGQVAVLNWPVTEGIQTNGLLPVDRLAGATVAVECRTQAPTTGWSNVTTAIPGLIGTWLGFEHTTGLVLTLFTNTGGGMGGLIISNATNTRSHSAAVRIDATNATAGSSYGLICDAVGYTIIDNQERLQSAATYCIDIDVRSDGGDCEDEVSVTTRGPGYAVPPGQRFEVSANWRLPMQYAENECRDRIDPRIQVSESSWLQYVGSEGNDKGRRKTTTGRRVEMDGGRSRHQFIVDPNTTNSSAMVTLQLKDDFGFASGSYDVRKVKIPIDIQQGPEFGTTWGSDCTGYDYCWKFKNPIGPNTFTNPEPGDTLSNTFRVANYGTAPLDVSAAAPGGMFQLVSASSISVPEQHRGNGNWVNHGDYTIEFSAPSESDLAQHCTLDGTSWICAGELHLTTNDSDPADQQVVVQLRAKVTAQSVLSLRDDQGATLPDTIDFGRIALGETQLVQDPANPQVEQCPADHFLRHFEIVNDGIWARTHARIAPSTPTNQAGAFVLNGPVSAGLAPGASVGLDLCVLPKATGHYEELLEIWQSTYPHDSIDVTLRWEGIEPVTVEWAGAEFADGDTLDFGMLSSVLAQSPTDLGLLEITNNLDQVIAVVAYPYANGAAWDLRGVADAAGQPFNPSYFWVLQPGESMDYGIDLLDVSAGIKTGSMRVGWGTPTSTSGTRALGYTPRDQIDIDVQIEMY